MQSWQYLRLNIQDYLNRDGSFPMTGNLDMSSNRIINLATPINDQDAVTKFYVDNSANPNYLLRSGTLPMLGDLSMGNYKIANLANPTNDQDAVTKFYVDSSAVIVNSTQTITGVKTFNSNVILGSSANLGVGITPTTYQLDVSGITRLRGNIDMSGALVMNNTPSAGDGMMLQYATNFNECILSVNSGATDKGFDLRVSTGNPLSTSTRIWAQADGKVGINTRTPTEIFDVCGNAKIRGYLDMSSNNKIINLANPTNDQDAATKFYVDASANLRVLKSGDTMTGELVINYSNPDLDIRASDQSQNSILYLSTPLNGVATRRKTALLANGLNTWNRADLYFCLNNAATHDPVTISDSKMIIKNSTGNVGIGTTTPSEKLDVSGNAKIRGYLDMSSNNKIINLSNPTNAQDAATKNYVDASANLRVLKSGDTMTGNLSMNTTNKITNLANGTLSSDAATFGQITSLGNNYVLKSGDTMTGNLNMNTTNKITNLANGTASSDAATFGQITSLGNNYVLKSGDTMTGALTVNNNITASSKMNASHIQLVSGANVNSQGAWIDWNANVGSGATNILNQKGGGAGGIGFGEVDASNNRTINMFLNGLGNLGIGTTTPSQKLDVIGNVNAFGAIISGGVYANKNSVKYRRSDNTSFFFDSSLNYGLQYLYCYGGQCGACTLPIGGRFDGMVVQIGNLTSQNLTVTASNGPFIAYIVNGSNNNTTQSITMNNGWVATFVWSESQNCWFGWKVGNCSALG